MATIVDMWRKARSKVLRLGVASSDADDVVQEAFIRLQTYARLHEVKSPEGFVVHAAGNLARDHLRRGQRSPFRDSRTAESLAADPAPSVLDLMEVRERLRLVNEGIDRLPEKTRAIFLAHRLDGLTYREIAEREQMSPDAVEKRVARAVLALMDWMDENER